MCKTQQFSINNLPHLNKMVGNRILTEIQLACSKAGGSLKGSDLKNMSLEHFICVCAMNQINISFK